MSSIRDEKAARQFFTNYRETTGVIPAQITTDYEKAFSSAIESILGKKVKHRTNK